MVKKYKTFQATWRPAGGVIRVVLAEESTGWRTFFCTNTTASVADLPGAVAGRFSLEITFRDRKEIIGAGQQQVRFMSVKFGAFYVCLETFIMTQGWVWIWADEALVDRPASPWDKPSRRLSHAGKRRG